MWIKSDAGNWFNLAHVRSITFDETFPKCQRVLFYMNHASPVTNPVHVNFAPDQFAKLEAWLEKQNRGE